MEIKKLPYTDNLCLFRCLGLHFGADVRALEGVCQELKAILEQYTDRNFDAGVVMEDLLKVEECFNVGINVYHLDDKKVAKLIRCTENESQNIMHLNLYNPHFSYISKFKSYSKKYQCNDCKRFISKSVNLLCHKNICQADKVKETFVGGKYTRR